MQYIPIILGTARHGRRSETVANFVYKLCKEIDLFQTELIDVRKLATSATIPPWEPTEQSMAWSTIVNKSAGFIIVAPEYNHGYPGELKILLDKLLREYENKPVGICSVSSGQFGGARMVENLLPVLNYLKMILVNPVVHFSNIKPGANNLPDLTMHGSKVTMLIDNLNILAEQLSKIRPALSNFNKQNS